MRRLWAVVVAVAVVACGAAQTPAAHSYDNPSGGPLPTFENVESMTEAADPDCDWQVDVPGDPSAETEATCEATGLWMQWIPGDHVTTVEEAVGFVPSDEEWCEHFDGRPLLFGGNWWAVPLDESGAESLASSIGGYLVAGIDCGDGPGPPPPAEDPVLTRPVVDWNHRFPGPVADLVGTPDGGVVVVGRKAPADGADAAGAALVMRLNPDGTVAWRDRWRLSEPGAWSTASGVDTDYDETIVVTGTVSAPLPDGTGSTSVMVLRKYDANGTVLWTRSTRSHSRWFDPHARRAAQGLDVTMSTSPTSQLVAVAGEWRRSWDGESRTGWIRAYDGSGHRLWVSPFEAPRFEGTRDGARAVDSLVWRGRVWLFAAGWVATTRGPVNDRDVLIQGLRQDGSLRWSHVVRDVPVRAVDDDQATSLVVSTAGGVLVGAAMAQGGANEHAWLGLVSDADGRTRWLDTWAPRSRVDSVDSPRGGVLYVSGTRMRSGHSSLLLRAYWGEGDVIWRLGGHGNRVGGAVAAADDAVYVASWPTPQPGFDRWVVTRYVEPR
jgi:hypothetical protein